MIGIEVHYKRGQKRDTVTMASMIAQKAATTIESIIGLEGVDWELVPFPSDSGAKPDFELVITVVSDPEALKAYKDVAYDIQERLHQEIGRYALKTEKVRIVQKLIEGISTVKNGIAIPSA